MTQVRVRFCPSPTGYFHIGGARTALFNWLYARHTGGVFILRIEDTDKERNSAQFYNVIYDALTWLGLNWDEGPKVGACGGGTYGPYLQSERSAIYAEYLAKLKAADRTYEKDGAIYFKLLGDRSEVFDEHRKKTVTKVKVAPTVIDDLIRGRVERMEDEDFVIVRSDGSPVFHFANVVDDITMKITHVIRGEDHLSNTSKHVELFKAFGAPVPQFAHIPLILKQNGPGKMSKRDQGALVEEYQRREYRPEALVNFLCLLGWNPGDDREKMPIEEIIRLFDLPGVNQSNARFDDKKLKHMNMLYLQSLTDEEFVSDALELFKRYIEKMPETLRLMKERGMACEGGLDELKYLQAAISDEGYFRDVMLCIRPKIKGLLEVLPAFDLDDPNTTFIDALWYPRYFFTENYREMPGLREKVMAQGDPKARLNELVAALTKFDFSSDAAIETGIKELAAGSGLGFGDYQAVARLAMTGTNAGPSITSVMRILGREQVQQRLRRFLAAA